MSPIGFDVCCKKLGDMTMGNDGSSADYAAFSEVGVKDKIDQLVVQYAYLGLTAEDFEAKPIGDVPFVTDEALVTF